MNNLQKITSLVGQPPATTHSNIPPLLHMIWVGDRPAPTYAIDALEKWKHLMPEWTVRMWGNDDITEEHFPISIIHKIHAATKGAQKADIMRYFIIEKYGGVYVDSDIIPHKSLEPIRHLGTRLVVCHDLPITWNYISIGFFAAAPHHPVFMNACCLCHSATINTGDLHMHTGPRLFGQAIANVLTMPAVLLEAQFFYRNKVGDLQPNSTRCTVDFEERFGTHWYAKEW